MIKNRFYSHKNLFLTLILLLSSIPLEAKDYKVLVLPSGGATAIISAVILEDIEHNTKTSITSLVDEIWCSSAGSIIAALLTAPYSRYTTASSIVQFFEHHFGTFKRGYCIRESACFGIGNNSFIQFTSVPLRVLTAAATQPSSNEWLPYDFSSDGAGSCQTAQVSLREIVAASCTVYPYLYRKPFNVTPANKPTIYCIDSGSLCCKYPIIDPTSYFLEQFLSRLTDNDTLIVYFIGNGFTQSIDHEEVEKTLKTHCAKHSYAICYKEGSFNPSTKAQVEIVNIAIPLNCTAFINTFLKQAPYTTQASTKIVRMLFEQVVGKTNADPNMLAAGVIPLYALKKEAQKIIQSSENYHMMLEDLKSKN